MLRVSFTDFKGNWDEHLLLIEFSCNSSYHSGIAKASFEALYDRKCRYLLCFFKVGEFSLFVAELVCEMDKRRQNSYADNTKRDLEFEFSDSIYLKIYPMKGLMRYFKKGRRSHRYVGPYEILKRVLNVAYELNLPR